jgi:tetratricopeptide (TPR) repeat protein
MNNDLAQKSIQLALKGAWKEAIKVNNEILKENPSDCDTLNRLAKAYFESGNSLRARSICTKIIKIDPINSIAIKNLAKWKTVKNNIPSEVKPSNTTSFIEESGKTKLVSLFNLGDSKVIANLDTCDEVRLAAHAHRVSITTEDGKYVGRLPDDLALRLRRLITLGNTYQAFIKSIDQKGIKIFIRETQKSKKSENTPSFPMEKIVSDEENQNP